MTAIPWLGIPMLVLVIGAQALARHSGYAPMAGVPRFVPRDAGRRGTS